MIQKRKYAYWLSGALITLSASALAVWGLRLGIDFKGGTLLEVAFTGEKIPQLQEVRPALEALDLQSLIVQPTGEQGLIVRYLASDEQANERVLEALRGFDEGVELIRTDFVGASVSNQIKRNALLALVTAVIGIVFYIAWAFRKVSRPISSWHYGIQANVALFHDILITLGVFAVLGRFFEVEIGSWFIAALLTILGYSVNDTIVVYDRIRENLLRSRAKESFEDIVNRSLNETLARSFNTSFTVIIVLLAIVLFGGESIRYFAMALLVGVGVGTYSSVYVASALLVTGYEWKSQNGKGK